MMAQTHIRPGSDRPSPRIGIPWRTSLEEKDGNLPKIMKYQDAVRRAGGEPVLLSLLDSNERERELPALDGFVLPGSSADVDPALYGSVNGGKSAPADARRDSADLAILKHAFAEAKPVLAICYGCQMLNVFLGGTLIQDIRSEIATALPHRKQDLAPPPTEDPVHDAAFEPESLLANLAAGLRAQVNSSHHQAVARPGEGLRVTARATDGMVEALEWIGGGNWVVGVQWHPERMPGDALSERLFADFVAAAGQRTCATRS